MTEIRWHGRGGQGAWSAARLLGEAAALGEGKYSLAFPSFGPERRGAPVLGFTRIDDERVRDRSEVASCDAVVVLDETLIDATTSRGLKENGIAVINTNDASKHERYFKGRKVIGIDATSIALSTLGKPITNTSMIGALVAATGVVSLDSIIGTIRTQMKGSMAEKNVDAVTKAFEAAGGSK